MELSELDDSIQNFDSDSAPGRRQEGILSSEPSVSFRNHLVELPDELRIFI